MNQLTRADATFLYLETDTLKSHFTMLTIYDQSMLAKHLRYRDILKYFEERIARLPVFRRKVYWVPMDMDTPYFADDQNFNIESHVRHIALPKPGDWRQFCILAAQIQAVPIDTNKPLWDMHVIGGLDHVEGVPPGSFAILTRMHHAIADGTTARGILIALHHPAGKTPPALPPLEEERPPTLGEMLKRGTVNHARQLSHIPGQLARLVPVVGPKLSRMALSAMHKWQSTDEQHEEPLKAEKVKAPQTVFNGDIEYGRVFQLRRYPLDAIKRIRELVHGTTVNDVVLTLIGGGLRRYLAACGEKSNIDLVALCPINLREDKFGSDSVQGNNISLMQVNLSTRTVDPAKRLSKVFQATAAAKLSQKASSAKDIMGLSKNAPNVLVALGTRLAIRAALRYNVRMANCLITNVPGPQEPLYFMGARLELFTGVAPVSPGTGITFPVSSYCGQLCISFTGCPSWISDPQLLAQCLDDSFNEMVVAVPEEVAAKKAAARKAVAKKAVAKKAVEKNVVEKKVMSGEKQVPRKVPLRMAAGKESR